MFEMSPQHANASSQTLSPLADSSANDLPLQSAPDFNQSLFEFFHVIDATLVHTLLHHAPNLVFNWVQVRAIHSGTRKSGSRAAAAEGSDGHDWPAHCTAGR